jgi:LPS sulfotransferase NodH
MTAPYGTAGGEVKRWCRDRYPALGMLSDRPQQPWRNRAASHYEWAKVRLGRGARLSFAEVHDMATAMTGGLEDAGDPFYEEGLRQLLDATHEADLTAAGRRLIWDSAWPSLARRMRLVDEKQRAPETFAAPLRRPFLVMGQARSGTTHLHRLLSVDERFRGLPAWELNDPFPPHTGPDRRREMAWYWYERRDAATDHIHFADPDSPEECSLLQMSHYLSGLYWGLAPVYGYAEWLLDVDHALDTKMYLEHRDYLLWLQAQHPDVALALKAPDHTARLAAIDAVIPEAMVVHTVRDPVASSNSAQSLIYQYHRRSARRIDVARTVEMNLQMIDRQWRDHVAARATCTGKVIDVYYDDLVRRPVETVRSIYDFHGVDWPAGHDQRLQAHLAANPRGRFGSHEYRSEDFGLTDRQLAARFADYIDHYGLDRRP